MSCEGESTQPVGIKGRGRDEEEGGSSEAKHQAEEGEVGTYLLESKPMKHKQTRKMSTKNITQKIV